MTIFTIALYTGIAAVLWTLIEVLRKKTTPFITFVTFIKNWIGTFFIFSAMVKLVDPVGFAIKLKDYFNVFKLPFLNSTAQLQSFIILVLELVIGVGLLFNAWKKFIYPILLTLILFFTLLTGVSAIFDVVKDCGCFGDFLKISPWTSFIKDIILTIMTLFVFFNRKKLLPFFNSKGSAAVIGLTTLAGLAFTLHNFYHLPIWDFRAYKEGTNIPEKMKEIAPPKYENTFIYKSKANGEVKEFVNSFPQDLTAWEFVKKEEKLISEGIPAPIHDFSLSGGDGSDLTERILSFEKPIVLIVLLDATKAKGKAGEKLKAIIDDSNAKNSYNYAFLSASSDEDLEAYKKDLGVTGSNLSADGTVLKTMIRSNPGIIVLKKGTIIKKYHYWDIPSPEKLKLK